MCDALTDHSEALLDAWAAYDDQAELAVRRAVSAWRCDDWASFHAVLQEIEDYYLFAGLLAVLAETARAGTPLLLPSKRTAHALRMVGIARYGNR